MNIVIDFNSQDQAYLEANARVRGISVEEMLIRVTRLVAKDKLVMSILDDQDELSRPKSTQVRLRQFAGAETRERPSGNIKLSERVTMLCDAIRAASTRRIRRDDWGTTDRQRNRWGKAMDEAIRLGLIVKCAPAPGKRYNTFVLAEDSTDPQPLAPADGLSGGPRSSQDQSKEAGGLIEDIPQFLNTEAVNQ